MIRRVTLISETQTITLDAHTPTNGWVLAEPENSNMKGWWESPAPRASAEQRPQANGAYAPSNLLVNARVLTIVAHHAGENAVEERQARNNIAALTQQWVRVVVEEENITSHVNGFISAQPTLTYWKDYGCTVSLIVTCPDPLIYAGEGDDGDYSGWQYAQRDWAQNNTGGLLFPLFDQTPISEATTTISPTLIFTGVDTSAVPVTNQGAVNVWPVLEADGYFTWVRWILGDDVVEWFDTVNAGDTLRINTLDGTVTVGGVRVKQTSLIRDAFFSLPPGTSYVRFEASDPATIRIGWQSAWM